MKGSSGPSKTILIGDTSVDTALRQAPWVSDPMKDSGGRFKIPVVAKIKAKAKTRKRTTKAVCEIFIL